MKTSFNDLVNSDTPVLIDFYADWCGPCKMMTPILEEVKQKMGDDVKIVKIDTDKNRDLSMKFGIRSIPTLMLFQSGKELWRQAGVLPADQIQNVISAHAS